MLLKRNIRKIGIDIDNTITSLDIVLEAMAKHYDKPIANPDDVLDYNISGVYGISEEEAVDFWMKNERWICSESNKCPILTKTIRDNFLHDESEIYIITARHGKYQEETAKWLEENDIKYHMLIMTDGRSKKTIIEHFNLDMMIDDKPDLFYEMEDSDTTMVCVDYGYNKSVPCDIRITREGKVLKDGN